MKPSTLIISISIVLSCVLYTSCSSHDTPRDPLNSTEGQKQYARKLAQREVRVTRVTLERGGHGCLKANQSVRLEVTDGEHGSEMHTFRDTHRDFPKFAALRTGQELRFEFTELDGDPNCSLPGGTD